MVFFTDLATNLDEAAVVALGWSNPSQEAGLAPDGSRRLPKSPGWLRTRQAGHGPAGVAAPPASHVPAMGSQPPRLCLPRGAQGCSPWGGSPFPIPLSPGPVSVPVAALARPSPTGDPARPAAPPEERALRAEPFWAPPRPVGAAAPEADGALGHSNGAERPRRR